MLVIGGTVSTSLRPWIWSEEEESWVRLAQNHAPVARVRPPGVERKTASCTVYAPSRAIGRTSPDVQSAAEWCDGQLLRLGFKLRLTNAPVDSAQVEKGMRFVWLRMWGPQPRH